MIRIKICGIGSVADAEMVVKAGADAIGLVFYRNSLRYVSVELAQEIIQSLPPFITTVGLFVDADKAFVEQVLSQVPLDVLQFHGQESVGFCGQFHRPYIKAIQVQTADDISQAVFQYPAASAILLDAYHPQLAGGTGQQFDWSLIPESLNKPLILAGGLTPTNVAVALAHIQPYAVDVSSGVEHSKGVKSAAKLESFCQAVRCYG